MALPVNISLMDVNAYIREHNCKQVSSMFIRESTSNEFHSQGLFSEDIFGQIGTPARLVSFGYIELRTKVFHPVVYKQLLRLKALYGEILSGRTYAKYDTETSDLVATTSDDPNGQTGYKFFLEMFPRIKFQKNTSITRNDKVDLLNKYRDICLIDKYLVLPAGLRDMSIDDGKPASDSINKIYTSLLNYTHAMPSIGSQSDIFDTVRFSIQKKVNEVYDFIFDMVEGKYGYFQRHYGSRNLALGTRNVISPADMQGASPDDPKFLKCDEVRLPLYEACKMYQPLVVYNMKQMFFADVFSQFSDKVSVIDPKTLNLVYQPISEDEKNKFLSTEGLEKLLTLFRDKEYRYNPIYITSEEDKNYYFMMVYDTGDEIRLTRSVSELISSLTQNGVLFDKTKLRPLTYAELVYISTYRATLGKCATVTRYPAIEIGSCVPCIAHISSSSISRTVQLVSPDGVNTWTLPEYPVLGSAFNDSLTLHPGILGGLGADFDGDTLNANGVLTNEANEEILKYLESPERFIHTNGSLFARHTDLINLTIFNLSR